MVRSNQREVRRPGDWFSPVRLTTDSIIQTILNSAPENLTLSIAGADQTNPGEVVISDHNRVYSTETVAVLGDTVTPSPALADGDKIGIYYDDESRQGGAVVYEYIAYPGGSGQTTDLYASEANPYRHFVALLAVPTTGSGSGGSGTGDGTGGTGGPGGGFNPPNEF